MFYGGITWKAGTAERLHLQDGRLFLRVSGRRNAVFFSEQAREIIGVFDAHHRGDFFDGMFGKKRCALFQAQVVYIGSDALIEFVFEMQEEGRAAVMKDPAQIGDGNAFAVMLPDIGEHRFEILLGNDPDTLVEHGVFGKTG